MQLYALDEQGRLVFAKQAIKQHDYQCIECQECVRLRKGLHRQPHFYHTQPNRHCHLSKKGMVHLEVQSFICQTLPAHEGAIEYRFPEIGRIADVAWIPKRLIFEVQCSPISAEEVSRRNQDYKSVGWEVVWILHDQRYNQRRCTAAEWSLKNSTHYFTNIDDKGEGVIYDQFAYTDKGVRQDKMAPLPLKLNQPQCLESYKQSIPTNPYLLKLIEMRFKYWSISFQGDLIDAYLNNGETHYLSCAQIIEEKYTQERAIPYSRWQKFKRGVYRFLIRPYRLLFQLLLERACR